MSDDKISHHTCYYLNLQCPPKVSSIHVGGYCKVTGLWSAIADLPLGSGVWLERSHWRCDPEDCHSLSNSSLLSLLSDHHDMSSFPLPDSSTMPFLPWNHLTEKIWAKMNLSSWTCECYAFCPSADQEMKITVMEKYFMENTCKHENISLENLLMFLAWRIKKHFWSSGDMSGKLPSWKLFE